MDVHRGADGALTTALALRDVHVRFGAVQALAGATLEARAGTVHALLGENGAGKTTLMSVAYGLLRPSQGSITVDGRSLVFHSPADALRAGIGMVHQHFTLVPAMTVAANVALGDRRDGWRYDVGRAAERVREIGVRTGLVLDPHARASTLGVGAQQRLEIVKALARDARVLILGEPTAVLSPLETEELLRWLRRTADEGRTVILITHKLQDALAIADDITVLRHGRTVLREEGTRPPARALAEAMLGTAPEASAARSELSATSPLSGTEEAAPGEVVIRARGLELTDERGVPRIGAATFTIRRGEIVGVAGVEGSGHRELLRALAGRAAPHAGALELARPIGFVPEDRQHDALALDLTLAENIALRDAGSRRGVIRWGAVRRRTRELIAEYSIQAPDVRALARTLSGGNQQKLVLARELDGRPRTLIVEDPTRGLDLRATDAVHTRLRSARASGMAIVLYSSDVDETLSLADRMLVVFDGTVREVDRDRHVVGAAMVGLS